MICINCKQRIPFISNLDFKSGNISLYCQCTGENEKYNARSYLNELNKIKSENQDINIINQICFVHKDEDIELFCVDCSKELCRECDLKIHQKDNHLLIKLDAFYKMIEDNLKYLNNVKDLIFFENFNIEFFQDIIKLLELIYLSFISQKNLPKKNFTPLKNICYTELILSEIDTKKDTNKSNNKKIKEKVSKKNNYDFTKKIKSMRKYLHIKKISLKDYGISSSHLNCLLMPNSYYCILISADNKLLVVNINQNDKNKNLKNKIEAEYILESKTISSIYKLSLLNEKIFALLYNSGSFDLFFIQKEITNNINLIIKKYINQEKSTNIISQINLAKEKNQIIALVGDKIQFFKYNENNNDETMILIKEIDRNNINLIISLDYHDSTLVLFKNQEIIIKDEIDKNNYIIDIKGMTIDKMIEIKKFNYLAITHFNSYIDIFDLNLMVKKTKLIGHKKIVNDIKELTPFPNSNYDSKLISCSDDKTIRIWNLINFCCETIIHFEKSYFLFTINILPDKEILAVDSENLIHIIE